MAAPMARRERLQRGLHKGSRTIPHPELSADELVADLAGGAGRTPLEAAIRAWIDANPDDGETA